MSRRLTACLSQLQDCEAESGQPIEVVDHGTRDGRRQHEALAAQEAAEKLGQLPASQSMPAERNAGHISIMHSGKMAEDVTGVGVAEYQPRLALVGQAIVGLDPQAAR